MKRWALTIATVLLVALWLASGFPGVRWHWPDVQGSRQGFIPFSRTKLEERTLWTAAVARGRLRIARYDSTFPEREFAADLAAERRFSQSPRWFLWPSWSRTEYGGTVWSAITGPTGTTPLGPATRVISLPLWIAPLLTGIAAALLWRGRLRILRRRRAGECPRCGYSLAGLPVHEAGDRPTCPECGTVPCAEAQPGA